MDAPRTKSGRLKKTAKSTVSRSRNRSRSISSLSFTTENTKSGIVLSASDRRSAEKLQQLVLLMLLLMGAKEQFSESRSSKKLQTLCGRNRGTSRKRG